MNYLSTKMIALAAQENNDGEEYELLHKGGIRIKELGASRKELKKRIVELESNEKKLTLALNHWASTARMLSQRVEELVKNDE